MKKILISGLLIGLTIMGAVNAANASSITNPDFEQVPTAGWNTVSTGSTNPTVVGWTVTGGGTWLPGSTSLLDMTGHGASVVFINKGASLFQTLTSDVFQANTNYILSFDAGWRTDKVQPGVTVTLKATDDGISFIDFATAESLFLENQGWTTFSFNLLATQINQDVLGKKISIWFANSSLSKTQLNIDNVSLDAAPVPEPATIMLLGSGLIGLAGIGGRRKK